jgi:hypothetical protein
MTETILYLLVGLLCIGAVILTAAVVITVIVINRKKSHQQTMSATGWSATTGRVTIARVEETKRTHPDDGVFFYPLVEFTYSVGGYVYTGKQALGKPFNAEFIAQRSLNQYPPGTEVPVYYNPAKPEESRLGNG